MSETALSPWISARGLWADQRWAEEGLVGGVTSRALGDMQFEENRTSALALAGLGGVPAYFARQVHGTAIVALEAGRPLKPWPEADGWATSTPGLCLGAFAADCMPLFLWRKGRAGLETPLGLFHSGWRGTSAGMPREAVSAFRRLYGALARELSASIGPRIGPCCYEVGEETARGFSEEAIVRREGRLYLDLAAAAAAQLREVGLAQSQIASCPACTSCGRDLFFSYRRDKGASRMMAFFAAEARP